MKKHDLLKAILIAFLIAVVLSWIIPTGSYSSTTFTSNGTVPVGIINLFRLPVMTMQTFVQYAIVLLAIGIFYGVLNKTGVYDNIVKGIAKKWKGKEKTLLIIVTLVFAILSSLTGLSMLLFVLVPFIAAILLVMGYDKFTVMLSTVGSIILGGAVSTTGFSGAGYIKNIFSIEMTNDIVPKIILFVIVIGLYLFFTVKKAKLAKTKKEEIEIPLLHEDKNNRRSALPLIITAIIFLVITFIGSYNWYYGWGIETFNNLDTAIGNVTIGSYPILSNILKGISILGYWGNYELAVALVIATCLIAWLYNVKLENFFDGIKTGAKEILPVALTATICNIVFTIMLANSGNMFASIMNYLGGIGNSFSVIMVSLMSIAGSLCYNDFYYLLSNAAGVLTTYDAVYYPIMGILTTAIYGIAMMILPTSVMLVVGLKYFNVSYKEWLKNIWKFLLAIFAILIIFAFIVAALV